MKSYKKLALVLAIVMTTAWTITGCSCSADGVIDDGATSESVDLNNNSTTA